MKGREQNAQRIEDILDIIGQNPAITSEQLELELTYLTTRRELASIQAVRDFLLERGLESEMRVKGVIEGFGFVRCVERTAPYGSEDQEGRDLIVEFWGGYDRRVAVQVKSSQKKVKEWIRKKGESKLIKRRIIVLNGQDDPEIIKKDFLKQLKKVDDYWRYKRKSAILPRDIRKILSLL